MYVKQNVYSKMPLTILFHQFYITDWYNHSNTCPPWILPFVLLALQTKDLPLLSSNQWLNQFKEFSTKWFSKKFCSDNYLPRNNYAILYIHLPSWILAVLEFGTIGSIDGWEALDSSHHAQHAQHRHSLSSHCVVNFSTRSALPLSVCA